MAARTSIEEQKSRRRKRLAKGLLLGGAAIGLPVLANALIARRTPRMPAPTWGNRRAYAWRSGEISYQRLGQGPPLLLIHSFGPGHDNEEWRPAAEMLASRYQVFAIDLLGWGRSERPSITYDSEMYIRMIADFVEDVVGEKAVIAAAGLPAAYAVQLAVDQPEKVRALALVVPSGINVHGDEPDLKDALLNRLLRLPVLGRSALNLFTSRASLSQYMTRDLFRGPEQADASRLEHYYLSSHQEGSTAPLAAYLSGYLNHSVQEAVVRLSAPLWLAWGRQATSPPVETADLWLQHARSADLEVLEATANLPHLEAPARFTRLLESYLAQL